MKAVVAVPLWLAVPLYVMYAAVWVAVAVLVLTSAVITLIGSGIFALMRQKSCASAGPTRR
jgi:hypothetical protein